MGPIKESKRKNNVNKINTTSVGAWVSAVEGAGVVGVSDTFGVVVVAACSVDVVSDALVVTFLAVVL